MKKLFTVFVLLSIYPVVFASPLPVPQKMSYQAVIRNSSNVLVTNQQVGMKTSILQGSATGTAVYVEIYNPNYITNANGLVTVEIGGGIPLTGTFSTINWATGPYFIKTETDPTGGTNYTITATSELLSVPYALHAKTVQTGDNWGTDVVKTDATIAGNGTLANPLKLAKQTATTGQVLKWNVSTWIPADNKAEGLFLPYKDSTTVADKETVFKLTCIGNTWSSAITGVSKSTNGTGVVGEGPFGVVGYATVGGGTGVRGVNASTTGSGFGLSGVANSAESGGIWGAGGMYGIKTNADSPSGYAVYGTASSTTGTTYGVYGRVYSSDGFSGYFTGGKFYVSSRVGLGTVTPGAGIHLKGTGFPESFMFLEAATGNDTGFRLYEGTTDKWHIFNSVGAGGLQIYNHGGVTAIFCKQDNSYVGIGTTTPAYKLQVGNSGDGTQARANAWNVFSDARLKKDFRGIDNPLEMVDKLNGYYYYWKEGTDQSRQVGFSAQEVLKVIPEVVSKGGDGYLSIDYGKMGPLLVEALKELKAENDALKARLEKLEERHAKE